MIVLEGPDNAGKSTLAKEIGLSVVHPGAAPKSKDEEQRFFRVQQELAGSPLVHDRVTCISQQVYQKRVFDPWYHEHAVKLSKTQHCLIIYCRPPDEILLDFNNHTVAEHDTAEQMAYVRENGELFVRSYDRIMYNLPHIRYDYTSSNTKDLLLEIISTQFHKKEWTTCYQRLLTMLGSS